ncbi:MAG: helicase-related protein [Promethearchaeota archaeon]
MKEFSFIKRLEKHGFEVRDYQLEIARDFVNNPRNIILSLRWGTGKTVIALLIIAEMRRRNMITDQDLILFTSGGAGVSERCSQALSMAKRLGFADEIGYLVDPKSLPRMRKKIYNAANAIFTPISTFTNDIIGGRAPPNTMQRIKLIVIDEASDIAARAMKGFRISKGYQWIIKNRESIPTIGLTAAQDPQRLAFIQQAISAEIITRDIKPFLYEQELMPVRDTLIEIIDEAIRRLIADHASRINEIFKNAGASRKLGIEQVLELLYGGILERLMSSRPHISILGLPIADDVRHSLIVAFSSLHKLQHARLLALESTPGALARYIQQETTTLGISSDSNASDEGLVFFPIKAKSSESYCDRCSAKISSDDWCFDVYDATELDVSRSFSFPTTQGRWCLSCAESESRDSVSKLLSKLDKKELAAGLRLTLTPEWRLIAKAIEERYNRTTLSGKTLHAVNLTRKLMENQSRVVIITRFRALARQMESTLVANGVNDVITVTGAVPQDTRHLLLESFKNGQGNVLVLTPVGGKGLDLYEADVIIQMDITQNIDEMSQRRERIRGGKEYILYYQNTSEALKLSHLLDEDKTKT